VKERKGAEVLEWDHGFATYYVNPPNCYIESIYVDPEHRQADYASHMADEVVKRVISKDCSVLLGSVDPGGNGSTTSLKVLLGYGFKLSHIEGPLIIMKKDIEVSDG
jgi:GNAT superfamily N-acetyltransferase